MTVFAIIRITEDGCCGLEFEETMMLFFIRDEAEDELKKDWYKNGSYKIAEVTVH